MSKIDIVIDPMIKLKIKAMYLLTSLVLNADK